MPIHRSISPLADMAAVYRLTRLFIRERFDIVHTHTPKAAFLGLWAATLAGVSVRINTVHGFYYLAEPPGARRQMFKSLEGQACRLATHVFSQSREDVDLARRENLVSPTRIEWLGNGIDLRRFDPTGVSAEQRAQVRAELGVPSSAFVIGTVARMVREKGMLELFEAFAAMRQAAPDAYLVHIGFVDRSRGQEVTPEHASQFGIAQNCRFLGQRSDIPRLLSAMDIYCLASYREGYPRSVMEANAMGLPAIVTNIRGCREAVLNEVNGLLVPAKQSRPLAEAMLRLYDDDDLRHRLSQGARFRAVEAFDERRVIQMILTRYAGLLGRTL